MHIKCVSEKKFSCITESQLTIRFTMWKYNQFTLQMKLLMQAYEVKKAIK